MRTLLSDSLVESEQSLKNLKTSKIENVDDRKSKRDLVEVLKSFQGL